MAKKILQSNFQQIEPFQDFLDNATVGIHLVDSTGKILYANDAELDMLGYTAEEYIGHNITEFHAEKDTIDNIFSTLTRFEKLVNREARLICKDGSIRDVLISSNVYQKDDAFIHTRCFTRDISGHKKAEKLLRFLNSASEELTGTLDTNEALDKVLKYIVPTYADWFTIDLLKNPGEVELVKMAHADPEKMKWAEKFREHNPVDLNDLTYGSIGYVLKENEAVLFSEITDEMIEASAKDQEHLEILRNLNLRSAMLIPMSIKGVVTGVVCFLSCNKSNIYDNIDLNFARDFTNRIALTLENSRLYNALQDEVKLKTDESRKKDEFISVASHELKTPITSLKALTQVAQMKFAKLDDPSTNELLAKMNRQVDKLTTLVVDLLDITKIQNGELVFANEMIDMEQLVKETVDEMQTASVSHDIKLHIGNCSPVKGDRNRIAQVIFNLLSNAIKYSPGSKEIIASVTCDEDSIRFEVKDTGIGIPSEDQPQIFNRFYKVMGYGGGYTFPGLGLGLYISSEIIKRHGGEIGFESEAGKGSTFYFTLPHVPPAGEVSTAN